MAQDKPNLQDILRAECNDQDLHQSGGRIYVTAQRADGQLYELGSICELMVISDPDGARQALERIKWARR